MTKTLGLVGVPTSMGAFAPGQEKGPRELRAADLLGRFSDAGVEIADHGDAGKVRRWRSRAAVRSTPDRTSRGRTSACRLLPIRARCGATVEASCRSGRRPRRPAT